ncbi:MAG: DnaJ domain-containing protein [Bryobacteraceae bacterium]
MSTSKNAQRGSERRRRARVSSTTSPVLTVSYDRPGQTGSPINAKLMDVHELGCGIELSTPLETGAAVIIKGDLRYSGSTSTEARGRIAWCRMKTLYTYRAGIVFLQPLEPPGSQAKPTQVTAEENPYEILQLSPNADASTIHRMYETLGRRFHPERGENPDPARYGQVAEAFAILTDSSKKAAVDARIRERRQYRSVIADGELGDTAEAEQAKRRSILLVLYIHRMNNPESHGLTVAEIGELLGVNEEPLAFAFWYLRENGSVAIVESHYGITVKGVDDVEFGRTRRPAPARIAPKVKSDAA